MAHGKAVVFVDSSVSDWQTIVAGVGSDTDVILLDDQHDGLRQIAGALSSYSDLSAIHIVSHGSTGQLYLGNGVVSSDNLNAYSDVLSAIGRSLSPAGDILLYGCNVAQGAAGQEFVAQLAQFTGADIAASTDLTGSQQSGGDWSLEASVGTITTSSINASEAYSGTLAVIGGTSGNDLLTGTSSADSISGGGGDDTLIGAAGNDTLNGGANGQSGDTVDYSAGTAGVSVDLTLGSAKDSTGNTDTLVDIEHVIGTGYNDTLKGSAGVNWFRPGEGNDTVDGAGGSDVVMYWDSTSGVTINLKLGTASGAGIGSDTLTSIENAHGSAYNDTITLSDAGGYVFGGGGNDSLLGGAGFDTFIGEAGNDTINGGAITDRVNYTDSNSVSYKSSTSGVNVNLATGKAYDGLDGVDSLTNINIVTGSDNDDVLTGSTRMLFEMFNGSNGDDVINGGAITDKLNLTNSNRVTYQDAGSAVIVDLAEGTAIGGGGNDILANFNQVRGSNFNDTLLGTDSDLTERFEGLAGNDLIDGRGGIDLVSYLLAPSAVNVNLATGVARDGYGTADTLLNIEGAFGSSFNDTLTGGNVDNGSGATDGFEFFRGEAGNDLINGGAGYDRVDYTSSTAGVSVTLGGTGNGTAQDGLGGTDTLINIEAVRGSAFNDTLTGSDSGLFESFEGREGNDVIDGRGGSDRVDYQHSIAGVTVNLNTGTAADGYGSTDTLLNIEHVRGSEKFNDALTGNAAANKLEGLGGNDTLNGMGGADTLIGGDGSDTYYVDNAGDAVIETNALLSSGGSDLVISSITYELGANVENLRLNSSAAINGTGNTLNNTIYAGGGANIIEGGAGVDTLSYVYASTTGTTGVTLNLSILNSSGQATASGISGADLVKNIENLTGSNYADALTGNAGANALAGGTGDDTLDGSSGNDVLNGGAGNDSLTGGAGLDTFVFNVGLSSTGNVDTITDFAVADDTIQLENAIFGKLTTTGTLNAANFKILGSAALDTNDYILYNPTTGALSYDADGSGAGAAVQFALIGTGLSLTNADFVVI